jgi:hypothetical protein
MGASELTDWEKQLAALRAVTATTGAVHEAQKLNVTMWGAIAFDWTKWEAGIDVKTKTVIFSLQKKARPKNIAQRIASLDRSIHWLFGPDWGLKVKEGETTLYDGDRAVNTVHEQRKSRIRNRKGD